ncbi:LTR retrotransposon, partial [Pseudoloma neurophilia]
DSKDWKGGAHILTEAPGERIGVDFMKVGNRWILIAIDYFTRLIFAEVAKNRTTEFILQFLDKLHKSFKFTGIVTDNAQEFRSKNLELWCIEKSIKQSFSVPYVHQINGRVERANRTIRDGIKKSDQKNLKDKLKQVVGQYNDSFHRGIGMSPYDALKVECHDQVKCNARKYAAEFTHDANERFEIGEQVLIRNENKIDKMDKEFIGKAIVIDIIGYNKYLIKDGNSIESVKHPIQLKKCKGGVVDQFYMCQDDT